MPNSTSGFTRILSMWVNFNFNSIVIQTSAYRTIWYLFSAMSCFNGVCEIYCIAHNAHKAFKNSIWVWFNIICIQFYSCIITLFYNIIFYNCFRCNNSNIEFTSFIIYSNFIGWCNWTNLGRCFINDQYGPVIAIIHWIAGTIIQNSRKLYSKTFLITSDIFHANIIVCECMIHYNFQRRNLFFDIFKIIVITANGSQCIPGCFRIYFR